jgi:acyl-[acyl-carrier-protein] desaturase
MPGRFMDDGRDPDLFDHFAIIIAQRINVYTVRDYVSIIDHLVKAWNIAGRSVTGGAARAQDEGLPPGRTVRADGRPDGCRA